MITTRADLDAITGTPEHAAFMALLQGSIYRTEFDANSGAWVAVEDEAMISQFGFTLADFPDRQAPDLSYLSLPGAPISDDVNRERDRRIYAGFSFGGKTYAFDPASKARVTGAATLAGFARVAGAQSGDLFWHGGDRPFRFIANDNSENEMDAQTCFAFGQAAAAHEEAHIFAARAIKDMAPIPADYTADSYWP